MSFTIPEPYNEPLQSYAPGSMEREKLAQALKECRENPVDVPVVINGEEIRDTGKTMTQPMPSDHKKPFCTFHAVNAELLKKAVDGALAAKSSWENMPFEARAGIFLRAADLLATKYRYKMLAALMLGQGKNVWQGEIDGACEMIDFLRFNVKFAEEILGEQPPKNSKGVWNRLEYRPLEGYVVAISPFNFLAIGGNLPTSPAMMGNVVLWKPASTAVRANYLMFQILQEAGLPDGVIQFVPGSGALVGDHLINHPDFAGLHFTGSTGVFNGIMYKVAQNLQNGLYKGYPRIVGETGGKDFHLAHPSADVGNFVNNTIRGAFEYQGQKCSACSRVYCPESIWPALRKGLEDALAEIKVGQPDDFSIFMTAVIDQKAFNSITDYIKQAKEDDSCEVLGGEFDDSEGFFVHPTVIITKDPKYRTMEEEIFGPVLTVYVYPDDDFENTLKLVDTTSTYALTGSIFANDRQVVVQATNALRHSAGNFYINDKCTGAVVGQQPFGGARASGTNDKAGSKLNLLRWCSPRAIKENFLPLNDWRYPHMA